MVSCQENYWIGIVTEAAIFQCESLFNGSMYINYSARVMHFQVLFIVFVFSTIASYMYMSLLDQRIFPNVCKLEIKRYLDDNNLDSRRE